MSAVSFLSSLFGWVYFLCWSLSFYPQPILNARRRSTSGTTVDFPFINILGFLAYLVSNLAFYYSATVRSQYAARNHGLTPTVQVNDIVFAAHALVLSLVTTSQYLFGSWLWKFDDGRSVRRAARRPSRVMLGISSGCIVGVFVVCLIVASTNRQDASSALNPASDWCELDIVYAVGYVKLVVTLIKFTPQVIANWRNKSTRGWSIWQILLDFAGGILSVAQQGIDSWLQGDWSGITGNPVKFALGNVSMVYDVIFMVQHYGLYRQDSHKGEGEREALLPDRERQIG